MEKTAKRPIVHPLGFIQLYLEERRRLHVWPEEPLKMSDPVMPIHDHTAGFTSRVLLGKIRHITYRPVLDFRGQYHLYRIHPYIAAGAEKPFEKTDDQLYQVRYKSCQTVTRGESYSFEPFLFHETVASPVTVTVVQFDEFDKTKSARVICPMDRVPDSTFRRDAEDPEKLWSIIRKAMKGAMVCPGLDL